MKQSTYVKNICTAFVLQFLFVSVGFSQNITVQGYVKNFLHWPLTGACVQLKGSSDKVFTDTTGFYKISVPKNGKLIFSCQKFCTEKISIKGRDSISIVLTRVADKNINTGYGNVKASQAPLYVSSVDKKAIDKDNTKDITDLLQSLPNVKVVNSDGQLKVVIRGIRSVNSDNFALIVLNGNVFYGSLADLERSSIKSIDVLKDAAEISAYGSRGANGVVLITTK